MISVSDAIVNVLKSYNVDTIFGIPGGAISGLYNSLNSNNIKIVNAKHETNAAFLAMGYYFATGKVGIVVTTAGPGITNVITGLASAFYEDVPLVVISGEVPTTAFGRGALQEGSVYEIDVVSQVKNITEFSIQITDASIAPIQFEHAIETAIHKNKPTFVSIPLNISYSKINSYDAKLINNTKQYVDLLECKKAAELLLNAKAPLLLVGHKIRNSKNREAVINLAGSLNIPVISTSRSKGVFPEEHRLYLGVFGFGGHESAIKYIEQKPDVILVCGSSLNDFETNAWSFSATKALIQIDPDLKQLDKGMDIDLGIYGDISVIIEQITKYISHKHKNIENKFLTNEIKTSNSITTIEAMSLLNKLSPDNAIFVSDMGEHLSAAIHYLNITQNRRFVTCLGFGSMGSGIGTAIGYQMSTKQRVYCICGDGCFLMYGNELATAVQHIAPITFLIANDSTLNMCRFGMQDIFGKSPNFDTQQINFANMAISLGADGIVANTTNDLLNALLINPTKPLVIDMRIDPEIRLCGSQRTSSLRQFKS